MKTKQRLANILLLLSLLTGCQYPVNTPQPTPSASNWDPPRVLVLTPEEYTIGSDTLFDEMILAAGGENAAAERFTGFAQISDTDILALNPDIILFTQTWTAEQINHWLTNAVYDEVTAVKNRHFYQLDFSLAETDLMDNHDARIDQLARWIDSTIQSH
jgi:ABC-type Fe3+-hydroxamate transport system substrate-binding protein